MENTHTQDLCIHKKIIRQTKIKKAKTRKGHYYIKLLIGKKFKSGFYTETEIIKSFSRKKDALIFQKNLNVFIL